MKKSARLLFTVGIAAAVISTVKPQYLNNAVTAVMSGVYSDTGHKAGKRPELVPCGIPFGLKLTTDGVIVTGFGKTDDGDNPFELSPAAKAGIEKGDVITAVNGTPVTSSAQLSELISDCSEHGIPAKIEYTRDGNITVTEVYPKADTDGTAKIGVWVRDSTAGIGTMTFYNEQSGISAGLGHAVCDIDTGQVLPLADGEIVPAKISGVVKGKSGAPGELCGIFTNSVPYGKITANTRVGLYSTLPASPVATKPIPMGYASEVKCGKAYILSTPQGEEPQKFAVEITSISPDDKDNKNLTIEVTDTRLLEISGGIVQGMSGSPIIQDGMLIGAVTHVTVNNPAKGYGIFAQTMYEQSITETE